MFTFLVSPQFILGIGPRLVSFPWTGGVVCQKKYFCLTVHRNMDEIVQMGPDLDSLNIHLLSSSKRIEMLLSIRYVLLGCHMFLSTFCDSPRQGPGSMQSTPELLYWIS